MIARVRRRLSSTWLHREVRGFQQERLAARELAYYRTLAERRRTPALSEESVWQRVRERIEPRNRGRWPKRKGDLEIFVACGVTNWESVLFEAFTPFGHVTTFDWRGLAFDDRAPRWPYERKAMNTALLEAFQAADSKRAVDVVVGCLSGHTVDEETVRTLAHAGACVVNFCWDDKLGFRGRIIDGQYSGPGQIASVVDVNLTNAPSSVVKYLCESGLAVFCPEAAQPLPRIAEEGSFAYDVSFVGQRYGRRPAFIERLRRLGVDVQCFGSGWPRGPIAAVEMTRTYAGSRINLGFSGVGYARRLRCLKGRDFEVPMAGGLYLTEANPELELVYRVGEEIETYQNAEDCAATIASLVSNGALANRIREAGHRRALAEHTYEARWEKVFRGCGLME
jgi:hypothetical protein